MSGFKAEQPTSTYAAFKREIIGDAQANTFLSREYRKGYEINM